MPARGLSPIRPEWNRLGPHVKPSFRASLKDIDPLLELQFTPPKTVDPRGVNPEIYPFGIWDIGKVINGNFDRKFSNRVFFRREARRVG